MDTYKYEVIRKRLKDDEILAQLAEEASELAQATLKLRRALTGTNPTPVTVEQAMKDLREEMADVDVAADVFLSGLGDRECAKFYETYRALYGNKLNRWAERLENK